tara:strand:- start:4040 stop:6280 length:2241 start_codon:yes stop_codon:yes gene_type:complete
LLDTEETIRSALNPSQYEAASNLEGPLLILAGAGSGKTRAITYRFANLILQGLSAPENILAVTFTNKAAREMQERVVQILTKFDIKIFQPLWIQTFHSICVRILREQIHHLGYQKNFTIYDPSDQLSLMKKVLRALNIDPKVHPPKSFLSKISWAKTLGLTVEEVADKFKHLMDKRSLSVFFKYEEEMQRSNALDFDDLLLKTKILFQKYPEVLKIYQERFQYIMVDEYQDTNAVQYSLIKMLAAKHQNLCVVGDEDQSIYSWRGADIQNILSFEEDFRGAKFIKLEQNYRSTKNIVNAATHLIQKNTQRKNKKLFTDNEDGEPIVVREELDEYAEARFVAKSLENIHVSGEGEYKDMAIFYRTNAQSRVMEDQLRSKGIPYKIVGGLKFYERLEIKDVLCYFRVIVNPHDDAAIRRIINVPTRGIGKTTIDKINLLSIDRSISFWTALNMALDEGLLNKGTRKKLHSFTQLLETLRDIAPNSKISDLYLEILEQSGYEDRLKHDDSPEAAARLDNLQELLNALRQFEKERGDEASLETFLEEMALVSEADNVDENTNCVHLMTLHISKGLEFPYVFIIGMEDGMFPSLQRIDSEDEDELEEERRLAYVGMTRAKKQLCLLYAKKRKVWGQTQYYQPSKFIEEIPNQYKFFSSSLRSSPSSYQQRVQQAKINYDENVDYIPDYEEDYSYGDMSAGYQKGMRVRHPSFGVGVIDEVIGQGDNSRISIVFQAGQVRTFVAKYARLEQI